MYHSFLQPCQAARARFGLARQDSSVCIYIHIYIYIYIYWFFFVHKPLYHHIYIYMGYISPIQALYTYIWIPYILLLPLFGCEYTLCHLHIPFQHVASLSSYITLHIVPKSTHFRAKGCYMVVLQLFYCNQNEYNIQKQMNSI